MGYPRCARQAYPAIILNRDMTLLNIILLIAGLAMLAVLMLVFFAVRLRPLLRAHLYHRAFSFFAVLAASGILFATLLSLNLPKNPAPIAATNIGYK